MRRNHGSFTFALLFFLSCSNEKSSNLNPQLQSNFSIHIRSLDPNMDLDSFRLLKVDTIFEKQCRMIDLFFYRRELNKVKDQLKDANSRGLSDSIAFYDYENRYMTSQIDSLGKLVPKADTIRPLVFIIRCLYQVSKKNHLVRDTSLYVLDNSMKIIDGDMIDSMITRSSRRLSKL